MKRRPVSPGQALSVTLFATLGTYFVAGANVVEGAIPFLLFWLFGWLLLFVRDLMIILKLPPYQ